MHPLDWIGLAACIVLGIIIGLIMPWRPPLTPPPPAPVALWSNPPYAGSKLAVAGQWITRCTDNSKVCRLRKDVDSGMAWKPEDCDSWTEPSPLDGERIAETPAKYWAACMPGFCWLHFGDGWRPQQPMLNCPK